MRGFGFIVVFILLCFPALEIYTLFRVADVIGGWWLLSWLVFAMIAGRILIQEEKLAVFGRMMLAMQSGSSPFAALWDSGRTMVAGVLLIIPGVISDAIALILLLLPQQSKPANRNSMPDDGIIEGEWREIETEKLEKRDRN